MIRKTARLYRDAFSGLSRDIWLLAMVTLVNRAGTMVIPFMTIYLTQHLHFSLAQTGYVMSCFGAGSIIGSYLGGRLTDTVGYYPTQFWTLFLSGLMFLLLAQMESFAAVCVTIFLLSIIADAFRPANFASVAAYSKPQNRTRSYSLLRLAVNIGFAVGPAVGGIVAHWMGYGWLFWIDGLTCMAAALLFRFLLEEKREEEESSISPASTPARAASAYQDRTFLGFVFFISLFAIVFMQFFFTMPVFFKEHLKLTEERIGLLLALNGLLVGLIEMPVVYRLETGVQKMKMVAAGALMVAVSYFIYYLFSDRPGIAFLAVAILTFGEIFNMPFANALAIDRSTPQNRGQYMGLYTMAYSIAMVIAPTVGLQIAESLGFQILLLGLTGLALIAFSGFLALQNAMERG